MNITRTRLNVAHVDLLFQQQGVLGLIVTQHLALDVLTEPRRQLHPTAAGKLAEIGALYRHQLNKDFVKVSFKSEEFLVIMSRFDTERIVGTVRLVNFVEVRNVHLLVLGSGGHFRQCFCQPDANLDWVGEVESGTLIERFV